MNSFMALVGAIPLYNKLGSNPECSPLMLAKSHAFNLFVPAPCRNRITGSCSCCFGLLEEKDEVVVVDRDGGVYSSAE